MPTPDSERTVHMRRLTMQAAEYTRLADMFRPIPMLYGDVHDAERAAPWEHAAIIGRHLNLGG